MKKYNKNMLKALKVFLSLCLLSFVSSRAFALETIEISGGGSKQINIAVMPYKELAIDKSSSRMHQIISADLYRSGFFRSLDIEGLVNKPSLLSEINYPEMTAIEAQVMTLGQVEISNNRMKVNWFLVDVNKKTILTTMEFSGPVNQYRAIAHKISDTIYEKLTGIPGVFSTKISYISKNKGRYSLNVADADGFNVQSVVGSPQPIISARWSPDGSKMAYVSFEKKKPIIYIQSLVTGQRTVLANFKGNNSSPAWSPDGKRLAIVLTYNANSQIYLIDPDGTNLKPLIQSVHIDTEPVWSPDGRFIYFTSDRGGRPQIYKVSSSGGEPQRISFEGAQNLNPNISPDGKMLTYVMQDEGRFRVVLHDLQSGQITKITEGAFDEAPKFSPNGHVILYAHKINGSGELSTVSIDGVVRQSFNIHADDIREPAWGPFVK
jgi:TolB protein